MELVDDEHAVVHSHIAAVVAERDTLVGDEAEPWRQALPDGPLSGRWVMTKWGKQSCCLPCNWLLHIPRKLVSKKKRRYQHDGFDIDLVYLKERVIVMGFPAVGVEHLFRNPRSEARRFLDTKHAGHYKVFNFCCEPGRGYAASEFEGRAERFPFLDHGTPMLETMVYFCESAQQWLDAHEDNVVALHCKAGKGRAGLMSCCLMLRMSVDAATGKPTKSAADVISFYDAHRVTNNKGLTVPCQLISVKYYQMTLERWGADILRGKRVPESPQLRIAAFSLDWDTEQHPPNVLFRVTLGAGATKRRVFTSHVGTHTLDCGESLVVKGTVCIEIFTVKRMKRKKLGILNFHTAFALEPDHEPPADANGTINFPKSKIDKLAKDKKDKKAPGQFHVVLTLKPYSETNRGAMVELSGVGVGLQSTV